MGALEVLVAKDNKQQLLSLNSYHLIMVSHIEKAVNHVVTSKDKCRRFKSSVIPRFKANNKGGWAAQWLSD